MGQTFARDRTLGAGRFELREGLASGGYGEVYRAYDTVLGADVALKVLHRIGPDALLAFKNEFRRLADLRHENLLRLGELFEEDGLFFFSMELVRGTDLLAWVRRPSGLGYNEARVRDTFAQIVRGLEALHSAGLLHRDLKPANVRVTPEGRVVLLDFGLVAAFREGLRDSNDNASGTAGYMAPEQVRSERVGPAVDIYAAGVVLFELLTGELPFTGTSAKILLEKNQLEPPRPSARLVDVPSDLDSLCQLLLAREPLARPNATQLLARLGETATADAGDEAHVFVGRSAELDTLLSHARDAFSGHLELVLVEGESGMGKTALVDALLARLPGERPQHLVLRGRCHAREQVRFKAVDGLLDELSHHLVGLNESARSAVLPARAALLTDLFPVLARVPGLEDRRGASRSTRVVERHEVFVVLVELLARLSDRTPLVLVTDDLQWGDEDSLALMRVLCDLLRAQPVLWVCTVRGLEEVPGELGIRLRELGARADATRVYLDALSELDARMLGALLLGREPTDPQVIELAKEAGGHPFFLSELSSLPLAEQNPSGLRLDLDGKLRARISQLPDDARVVLEILAVASAPVPLKTLSLALRNEGLDAALAELRSARLVQSARSSEVVCYHDRVREVVLSTLPAPRLSSLHRRLALGHEQNSEVDPAVVAEHWIGAGDTERALPWLVRAAELCVARAAFERAALLYERLLSCELPGAADRHRYEVALGEALAAGGRCAEAAKLFQRALVDASPEDSLELARLAAQRLLQAAEVEAGIAAARTALAQVDLSLAHSTFGALFRVGLGRARVALSGLDRPAPVQDTSSELTRAQLDTLWRLGQPLGWADLLAAAEVAADHVSIARATGHRSHLALALSSEALFAGMQDPEGNRVRRLLERAGELIGPETAPDVRAFHALAVGQVAFFRWDLREAERLLTQAEQRFHDECPAEHWLLTNARSVLLGVWLGRGQHRLLAQRSETWLSEAIGRGDRFALTSIGVIGFGFVRHLMRNAPELALAQIDAAMVPWRGTRFGIQHFGEVMAGHTVRLYTRGTQAHEYWQAVWPQVSGSFMAKMRFAREVVLVARARACLFAAACEPLSARKSWTRQARSLVHSADLKATRFGRATRAQHAAEIALLEGNPTQAIDMAREAQRFYGEGDHFVARLLDYFIARIEAGEQGAARAEAVLAWLRNEGWERPELCIQLFVPATAIWAD